MKTVTADHIAEIKRRVVPGAPRGTAAVLARELGISPNSISKVIHGKAHRPVRLRSGPAPKWINPEGRTCTGPCGKFLPWSEFSPSQGGLNGRRANCKSCVVLAGSTPDARRAQADQRLRREFGITLTQYEKLLAEQDGVCARCQRPERCVRQGVVPRLHVDHDRRCCPGSRSCGKCIRGLLCNHCNRVLGDIEKIPNFMDGLENYRSRRPLSSSEETE